MLPRVSDASSYGVLPKLLKDNRQGVPLRCSEKT